MKDVTGLTLHKGPTQIQPLEAVEFCLDRLDADNEHLVEEEIAKSLTYEEVIGALILARDELRRVQRFREYNNSY
jgi:hypothetical protein